jgi:hypothetical protein
MENPLIAGFVEIQHELKLGRGAAKRLRAKLALVFNFSSEPIFICNFNDDGVM